MVQNTDLPFDREHRSQDETVRLLAPGQRVFGRYTLIRVIGRGGMGVVWLARDEELKRSLALKFLPESVAHDKEATEELKRETRRSLELTHPNIVRIYDFVHDTERAAIAMEHIDGRSLSAMKAEQPRQCFEVKEIAPWVQQLCAALDYAHKVGQVVHQDLKPANLMVNAKGQLKVTDFGIARSIADSVTRITAEDTMGGTLVYMSPQQLNGEKPSASNDIYSLGATLYDLLTGKPPFFTGALAHQIEKKAPPPMSERRAEFQVEGEPIPAAWEETIAACLAKRPEERPESAADVAKQLGLHVSEPSAAWMTRLPGRAGEKQGLRRLKLAIGAAAAGMLLIAGAIFLGQPGDGGADAADSNGQDAAGPTAAAAPRAPRPSASRQIALEALGTRFTNSLGMVFVRAAGLGNVFFSVWETRVQDFEAFVKDTGYDATAGVLSMNVSGEWNVFGSTWKAPGWEQGPTHPVVGVSRRDAEAFNAWLNELEASKGGLPTGFVYRLPTDQEWSFVVGLGNEPGSTPAERDSKAPGQFPWGAEFPPPPDTGNYALATDRFSHTSPVGSFPANALGLFDLGGNVWEWCEDGMGGPNPLEGVLRGGSFLMSHEHQLLSSRRRHPTRLATTRNIEFGFRCVLARPTGTTNLAFHGAR